MTLWHSLLSLFASPPCHNYHTRHDRPRYVTIPAFTSTSLTSRSTSTTTTTAHRDDDLTIDSHLSDDTPIHEAMALARHNVLSVAAALFHLPPECLTTPPMIDPRHPSSSHEERDHRRKIDYFLSQLPKTTSSVVVVADGDGSDGDESLALDNGYSLPDAETRWIDDMMNATTATRQPLNKNNDVVEVEHKPSTYGEVTALGARQLFHYMDLSDDNDDDVVFWDLGSGLGKLVVQAYLEIPRLVSAVGVELSPSRHIAAQRTWGVVQKQAKELRAAMVALSSSHQSCDDDARVALYNDDFFQCDISNVTHIYVASLCFTDDMMERLRDKLITEGLLLRGVATLKPFPEGRWDVVGEDGGRQQRRMVMSLSLREYVEMSWTKSRGVGCAVYFYSFDERE